MARDILTGSQVMEDLQRVAQWDPRAESFMEQAPRNQEQKSVQEGKPKGSVKGDSDDDDDDSCDGSMSKERLGDARGARDGRGVRGTNGPGQGRRTKSKKVAQQLRDEGIGLDHVLELFVKLDEANVMPLDKVLGALSDIRQEMDTAAEVLPEAMVHLGKADPKIPFYSTEVTKNLTSFEYNVVKAIMDQVKGIKDFHKAKAAVQRLAHSGDLPSMIYTAVAQGMTGPTLMGKSATTDDPFKGPDVKAYSLARNIRDTIKKTERPAWSGDDPYVAFR